MNMRAELLCLKLDMRKAQIGLLRQAFGDEPVATSVLRALVGLATKADRFRTLSYVKLGHRTPHHVQERE